MSTPTPGSSPLVERIGSDTEYIHVSPVFGALLHVAQFRQSGPADGMHGAVAAVTVYGDGRIEYHPVLPTAADEPPVEAYPGELAHLRSLLREVEKLAAGATEGSPLAELLVDHYSDCRYVDAQLAEGGDA